MKPNTRIASTFGYDILGILTLVTRTLQVVCGCFTYCIQRLLCYRRCIFSMLELDARCEWRFTPSNMHWNLFSTSHLCVLAHIISKVHVLYVRFAYRTTALLYRDILCEGQSYMKDSTGEIPPQARIGHSFIQNIVCIYRKLIYTLLFGMQQHLTTKLTHLMTVFYTPNDGFTANDASFYKNKFGQLHYTLQCLFN